jgi:hypothetical protein
MAHRGLLTPGRAFSIANAKVITPQHLLFTFAFHFTFALLACEFLILVLKHLLPLFPFYPSAKKGADFILFYF